MPRPAALWPLGARAGQLAVAAVVAAINMAPQLQQSPAPAAKVAQATIWAAQLAQAAAVVAAVAILPTRAVRAVREAITVAAVVLAPVANTAAAAASVATARRASSWYRVLRPAAAEQKMAICCCWALVHCLDPMRVKTYDDKIFHTVFTAKNRCFVDRVLA
jgi:hypothetical protein